MRRRRPKKTPKKARTAEERARARRATQECRDRVRKGFGLYFVAIDNVTLDALVRGHYLTDEQLFDKEAVNRALSSFLWDQTHSLSSQKLSVI